MESFALSTVTHIEVNNFELNVNDLNSFKQFDVSPNNSDINYKLASEILMNILEFRRSPQAHINCDVTCPSCQSPHLQKVINAIKQGKPISFVLPAFPGKSPNLSKVLGILPDMAERLALQFLDQLMDQIRAIYAPGAHTILCSDGRVFSDVIGMQEINVTAYQQELDNIIKELALKNISTFNLDELCVGDNFVEVRQELMKKYGSSHELLREKVLRGSKPHSSPEDEEAHRMYCGITRFLVEDATFPGQTKSRTAIQKECKAKAYTVIRRSNAWSELLAEQFPHAVRLSIHPQTCGAKKLGIRLIGTESWMTPWHGVAVKTNDSFVLMKRTEAETLGAQLVLAENGYPSHFELSEDKSLNIFNKSNVLNEKFEAYNEI